MYQVEIYGRIRRAVLVEGRSQRSVAREFGLARVTVRKMLGYSIPPGYRRKEPVKRPKLGPWMGVIDAILEEDKTFWRNVCSRSRAAIRTPTMRPAWPPIRFTRCCSTAIRERAAIWLRSRRCRVLRTPSEGRNSIVWVRRWRPA